MNEQIGVMFYIILVVIYILFFVFFSHNATKNIITYDCDKIIQNTVGLKRWVDNNITYPYGYQGETYTL